MRPARALAAGVLGAGLLAGCGAPSGQEGECNLRYRWQGATYRPVNGLQTPHRGERLGVATGVDCDGSVSADLGRTPVYAVAGEPPDHVVFADGIVHLDEALDYADRPQLLRDAERFIACRGPARFTGRWEYVEPEDMPDMEDYASARVPVTGVFRTRRGSGVDLDRWAVVQLQAEITADTRPVPDAGFLRLAVADDRPVRVDAVCRDGRFEVTRIGWRPT